MVEISTARLYEDTLIPSKMLDYYVGLLYNEKPTQDGMRITIFDVYNEIRRNTPHEDYKNKNVNGVTIAEIKDKFKISQFVATEIIQLLLGTTTICYRNGPGKRVAYYFTVRGYQLFAHIKEKEKGKGKEKTL